MNKLNFSDKDYKLLKSLCGLTESNTYATMEAFLRKAGYKVEAEKNYMLAFGETPVALVAHMDTVFPHAPYDFFYDREEGVIWSPDGAGFDDRAGIFAIVKLVQSGFRPTIILTLGEEHGGIGAYELITKYPEAPMKLKYLIELDRQGVDDCVFYKTKNRDFVDYVRRFGFRYATGTFSDISIISPAWQICSVNLSIGYVEEHSYTEHLYVRFMLSTINKVKNMIAAAETAPVFDWNGPEHNQDAYLASRPMTYDNCANCGKKHDEYELYPLSTKDGNFKGICYDCLEIYQFWCEACNEPYFPDYDDPDRTLCYECEKELLKIDDVH